MKIGIYLSLLFALAPASAHAAMCPAPWDVQKGDTGSLPNGAIDQTEVAKLSDNPGEIIEFARATIAYFALNKDAPPFATIGCEYEIKDESWNHKESITLKGRYDRTELADASYEMVLNCVEERKNGKKNGCAWEETPDAGDPPKEFKCVGASVDRCAF